MHIRPLLKWRRCSAFFIIKKRTVIWLCGRLDATNVIPDPQKLLAVFASVSMDHMAFLGDSLGQIAKEKAGIITQGCSVVTMEQREEVMDVFQKVCLEKQAVLTVSKPETASSIHYGLEKQTFLYRNRLPVTIRLAGNYQITNALLALQEDAVAAGLDPDVVQLHRA